MLADQFHLWILGSGVLLTGMALVHAAALWKSRGADAKHCKHDHGDENYHDSCHEHGHHDHEWAPWRYVVLLVPIILVLLGFPNKGPEVRAAPVNVDMTYESAGYAALIGSGVDPWQQLVSGAALSIEPSFEPAILLDFKTLLTAEVDRKEREYWKGKRVRVTGQFAADTTSYRVFNLVRYRIRCCPGDALKVPVPAVCKENISDIKTGEWVQVTGRLDFHHRGGRYRSVLQLPNRQAIVTVAPDPFPYVAN